MPNAEILIFRPMLALVLLSPLPLGGVMQWTWAAMAVCVGILLALWALLVMTHGTRVEVPVGRIWLPALLFLVAAAWAGIQMAPWVPEEWRHPIWATAARHLGRDIDGTIAVDTWEAGSALLRLLTYAGIFWLTLQFGRDRGIARYTLYALAGAGVVYAVYGLAVHFSGAPMILWYEKLNYRDDLTSTFVYHNAYAAYAGLGLLCVTALLTRRVLLLYGTSDGWRQRLRALLNEFAERDWVLFLAWVVLATALLLAHSRGGLASAVLGMAAFLTAIMISPHLPSRVPRALAVALFGIGVVFFTVSGSGVMQRLTTTSVEREQIRVELFHMTTEAISDAPVLGTGFGSFEEMFYIYRGATQPYRVRSTRAHNTYLENAMELGIPGAAALTLAIAGVGLICLAGIWRRQRGMIYPAVGFAATVMAAFHSLFDFNFQIPAVAATYSVIMGLACAQSWSSRTSSQHPRR